MKTSTTTLQFIIILFLYEISGAESQNNSLWLRIGSESFYVEPTGQYTWKEAAAECKTKHLHLINPKGDYDYAKLKDAIKRNFTSHSSFWTSARVKSTNIFHYIGLGKEDENRQKCTKFDNSSTFNFLPENCNARLGFICEKSFLTGYSSFNTKNQVFFVKPEQEYTCEQAYDQCEKHQMFLVILEDYEIDDVLKSYLSKNYNADIDFWFGYNNKTHYNCATLTKNPLIRYDSKLGFICQRAQVKMSGLSMRHTILLVFVTFAAFVAITVFIVIKRVCSKEVKEIEVPQEDFSKGSRVTDIK